MRQSTERRLSVLDVVLRPHARHQRWVRAGLAATMLLLVVIVGLWHGPSRSPGPGNAHTLAQVRVRVAACPVVAADYAGTPWRPKAAPATLSLPASLAPPANAQIFGTWFVPGPVSYLLGPRSATCQAGFGSADGGEGVLATLPSDRSAVVTMTVKAGGLGPSTDLACPYIPAVYAADKALRRGSTFCTHPSAEVIRQIPTGTASLYAAVVFVPPSVKDSDIAGSGGGTDPAVVLYTAWAGSGGANAQSITCTLAPAQGDVCVASLRFFLATQSAIRTQISAAHLAAMEQALSSFLAAQYARY